jgi:hypothetical protein
MSITVNGKLKGKAARTVEATGIARGTETEELANSQWDSEFALRDLLVDDMTPELDRIRYAITGAYVVDEMSAADEDWNIGGEPVFNSPEWFDSIPEIPF